MCSLTKVFLLANNWRTFVSNIIICDTFEVMFDQIFDVACLFIHLGGERHFGAKVFVRGNNMIGTRIKSSTL